MYYQSYDDYMRSALGYEPMSLNNATYPMMQQPMYDDFATQDLNEYYPDIYRIVYPAVCSVCSKCDKRNISGVSIDDMVDTVYRMIEETNNDMAEFRSSPEKTTQTSKTITEKKTNNIRQDVRQSSQSAEAEKETRAPKNFLLNDLIRILILRELIGNRPPIGPRPPRPPMPPPPPPGGMRPPPPRPRYF